MSRAMVLAAGFGTRLRPLSERLPKPLVPLGDRPLLAHVLEQIRSRGHGSVVVNTHHLAQAFAGFDVPGIAIEFSVEREILGTAGGIAAASHRLEFPCVVWNGDVWLEPDLSGLLAALEASTACLLVAPAQGAGTVGLDARGGVVRLRGERFGTEQRAADYVGVVALGEAARRRLPARGCLVQDVLLPALRAGETVTTLDHHGTWYDVGAVSGYLAANVHWLRTRGLQHWVGPGAELAAGIELDEAVVGSGAVVSGAGALRRCVVWPSAEVNAPFSDCVVSSDGLVVPAEVAP